MHHTFSEFLRTGAEGEFVLSRSSKGTVGRRTGWSVKNTFPNYSDLRAAFNARLNEAVRDNAQALIEAYSKFLEGPISPDDLPDVSDAVEQTLDEWDSRLTVIWAEWNSHPQRLRPVRQSMEERLLRGFTGLVGELRQRALGVEFYVWRSEDDEKVRRAHAVYDDQVFRWDDPPEDGHPGQAINCRCRAEPFIPRVTQNVIGATAEVWDGFTLRHPNDDRIQEFRNAAAEMRALRPALEALAAIANKTDAQEAEQRLLAQAFREAVFRYALAAPLPNALASSDLLFGPLAEQEKLLAEAEAFRQGMLDLARGMGESPFFDGTTPGDVLEELRTTAPESAARYLDAIALLAGVEHLPQSVLSGDERRAALRNLGRGLVAAARGVEQERWGGRPFLRNLGELAQWDALHDELQRIAGLGVSDADGRAVRAGMREETGRRFYPEALALVSGGLLGAVGRAAPRPIRITPDMLDDSGRFLGQRNAGQQAPRFGRWLENSDSVVEIMPGGQVRYTTRINDASSSLNGLQVSVSYTDGVPDFSQLGLARVDIPNPVGRGPGINDNADLRAASRALWQEIEAGRVPRSLFTQTQLDHLAQGRANPEGLTWHHDGLQLNPNGTGPMLLLDATAHGIFQHVGWASRINR
ncbi:MAG: phage minor head protein [Pseudomonadota bacterium]